MSICVLALACALACGRASRIGMLAFACIAIRASVCEYRDGPTACLHSHALRRACVNVRASARAWQYACIRMCIGVRATACLHLHARQTACLTMRASACIHPYACIPTRIGMRIGMCVRRHAGISMLALSCASACVHQHAFVRRRIGMRASACASACIHRRVCNCVHAFTFKLASWHRHTRIGLHA